MYEFGPFTNLVRTSLLHELKQHLSDHTLHHPMLHFAWVDPRLYSRLNQLYEHRLRKATGLNGEPNEWELLRPDLSPIGKANWFLEQLIDENCPFNHGNRQDDYHRIIGQMWTDPEVLTQNSDTLTCLFRNGLPSSPIFHFMVEDERNRFAELPEELQVFRGHVPVLERRHCWTLNPNVAIDWACKCEPGAYKPDQYPEYQFFAPIVTVGTVSKTKILAYVNRRQEDEILVNSDYVRDRQSYDVFCK